jgi:flagellar hook-length control protein FliK
MVQLSSPPVEMIPVQKGPSPDKNSAPKFEDRGFRTAFNKQKEIHESRDAEQRAQSTENVSDEKPNTLHNENDKDLQNAEEKASASTADKSESAKDKEKASGLKLVKADKKDKSALLSAATAEEESGNDKKAVSLNQEAVSMIAASELKAEPVNDAKALDVEASALNDAAEELIAADKLIAVENSDQKPLNDFTSQIVKTASSSVQHEITEKESSRDSKSRVQKKSEKNKSDIKITVDDRRTVKEASPVLKKVLSDSASNKLTLELIPSDDVSSAMPQGEQADTGRSFSLMIAEEQKGAALLDRQLQDKGTQELSKNIRFVLKDNKEGEIKLILKPEALGKVRINLNLNENHIVGKIIVENNSVRQVFMNNLSDLTKALEDSGFSSASLDVSVGGGQTQSGSQYREEAPVYFTANALDNMDGQIPVIYEDGVNMSQINMMV